MQFLATLLPFLALAAATPLAMPEPNQVVRAVASPAPTGGSGNGQAVVNAAASEEGTTYVFGGGGCAGPSNGGFDCSGLTQYSLCKAVGKTIPRNSQQQYNSGTKIARAMAQPGDLIFWATGGNCATGVVHVAVFVGSGEMINAPHTGTVVREQKVWTSSGGESICPYAVRYW